MKISVGRVKNIPGKIIEMELQANIESAHSVDNDVKFSAPVAFSGKVENTGETLNISGKLSAVVELVCCRCAEKVLYSVETPFYEIFSNNREFVDREKDHEIYFFEGEEINISPQVVQALILELPMKVLCKEECKGLCPGCGVNLNYDQCQCTGESIDPRLMGLKKLLDESCTEGGVINGSTKKKDLKGE